MAPFPKLKDQLPYEVKTPVVIIEAGQEVPGKFGPQFLYGVQLKGQNWKHYATPAENEKLSRMPLNVSVSVVKKKNSYGKDSLYWEHGMTSSEEAASAFQQTEKSVPQAQRQYDDDKLAHDFKLGLAGIVQAMIVAGKSKEDIAKEAPAWVIWIRKKAKEMAEEETIDELSKL